MAAKTLKKYVSLTDNEVQTFLAENETLADFGRLPERHLLSVRTRSINETYVN